MGEPRSIERWVSLTGSILAPAGAVTALLFYFGYASTRAKYEYFGVDVDTVGLDTRDFLMRSPQPLLVPLVLLAVMALLSVWLHVAVRGLFERTGVDTGRPRRLGRASAAVVVAGAWVLVSGVVLVLVYPWLRDWSAYDMVTPVCLMTGVVLVAYGQHLGDSASTNGTPSTAIDMRTRTLRRVVWILCAIVVAGSVFWASSTLAEWSGRGQAVTLSGRFRELPSVILDTKERLYVRDPVIKETVLPIEKWQTFRYRYRSLRLLIEGGERMFLVPDKWSNSGSTLVVPMDESVRIQFQFQNRIPADGIATCLPASVLPGRGGVCSPSAVSRRTTGRG